ncbi:PREDICTED: transcription elongation factor A N-terminal and central domain-containing protein 2-like [Branchiostoma belcheri]|uniref:Transcription elongation factor A N-terminal and central domain-containing protein 2-like n=1 Tax=Branchiostoma belcheri TaxID=7741 RepID=A0A6P4YEL9_BRABE|nr:PREDICTED: transcription elongation factor A N-terminal and central domain-containing protein 2-like [Branchiostoma belcheri]
MDKFVVRLPRETAAKAKSKSQGKVYKQATIESLQRVVVIDDIERLKVTLELEGQASGVLLEALTELNKKIPSKQVLLSTKIGHAVNKLKRHEDKEVASLARSIVYKWKHFIQEQDNKPVLEVRCDLKTEKTRTSGRRMLADSLGLEEGHLLPENIERETFHECKRLLDRSYKRTMRKLIFTLKGNEDTRKLVLSGELAVKDLVKSLKCKS